MRPLFVGGCERSGTTMLGAMLGSHSRCFCVPESHFIEMLLSRDGFDPDRVEPRSVLASIVGHERYRVLWNRPIDPQAVDPKDLGSTYASVLSWLVREFGRGSGKADAGVWVDQTPSNFKRALTLMRMFPDARFVHIVRDGRGVAASILPLDWGPNDILRAAEYWMARCAPGLAAESQLGSNRVMRVRYEDLLTDPEPTLRRVATFTGLEYEPAMAQGAGYSPTRYHERQHRLVGRPPDPSRAISWNQSLTPRQVELFESVAGEFLEMLGYRAKYGMRARPAGIAEAIRMEGKAIAVRFGNYLRRRQRSRRSLEAEGGPAGR